MLNEIGLTQVSYFFIESRRETQSMDENCLAYGIEISNSDWEQHLLR
ncbi:hypothetical protein [Calothrix sp. PCC 7507]|nr:hypothetical protein [Calothrix sp. PCC 7507]AFY31019.1 hypothetical protein Cal7507_0527 [Calothrix sp. PCC 7507]